jgi:uncharacterized protein (TIGR04255 family)
MTFKTPLVEAVAEVDFVLQPLIEFRALAVYRAIQGDYPAFERLPAVLIPNELGGQQLPSYLPAIRFFSSDRQRLVQYGPRLLTFNETAYPGWATFKERFSSVFRRFAEMDQLVIAERFQLQYVNRLPAVTPTELQRFLTLDLNVTEATLRNDFLFRRTDRHDLGMSSVLIGPLEPDAYRPEPTFGVTCSEVGFATIQFDAERFDSIVDWFEKAHTRVKDAFWNLLNAETQRDWRETYAERAASQG